MDGLQRLWSIRLVHLTRAGNLQLAAYCHGSPTTTVIFFVEVLWPRIGITMGVALLVEVGGIVAINFASIVLLTRPLFSRNSTTSRATMAILACSVAHSRTKSLPWDIVCPWLSFIVFLFGPNAVIGLIPRFFSFFVARRNPLLASMALQSRRRVTMDALSTFATVTVNLTLSLSPCAFTNIGLIMDLQIALGCVNIIRIMFSCVHGFCRRLRVRYHLRL